MFSKVAKIICTAVFTLIHRFQNSPNVNNNLFGPLLIANLLPRTLKIAQSGHNGHGTNGKSFFLDKVQQIVTKRRQRTNGRKRVQLNGEWERESVIGWMFLMAPIPDSFSVYFTDFVSFHCQCDQIWLSWTALETKNKVAQILSNFLGKRVWVNIITQDRYRKVT